MTDHHAILAAQDFLRRPARFLVYVAGPISQGDTLANIARAAQVGLRLIAAGCAVHVPHTHTALLHFLQPLTLEAWLETDIAILRRCDAILCLDGPSDGRDIERQFAILSGIPVFDHEEALLAFVTSESLTPRDEERANGLP